MNNNLINNKKTIVLSSIFLIEKSGNFLGLDPESDPESAFPRSGSVDPDPDQNDMDPDPNQNDMDPLQCFLLSTPILCRNTVYTYTVYFLVLWVRFILI